VDGIKRRDELRVEIQGISLNKGIRVVWLWLYIYTNDIESSHAVAGGGTTSTTEQIKQPRLQPKSIKSISLSAFSGYGSNSLA